jgi:hypothetical protein
MRRLSGLFDEFAAALQFPLCFGEDWEAFNERLVDMENMPAGKGYVVTIIDPEQLGVKAWKQRGAVRAVAVRRIRVG